DWSSDVCSSDLCSRRSSPDPTTPGARKVGLRHIIVMLASTLYFGDVATDTPYRDPSGRPLANARLTFWESGTTRKAAVYTGASLSEERQQPVVANEAGIFPPIFLDPDLMPYRVKLERADGVLV